MQPVLAPKSPISIEAHVAVFRHKLARGTNSQHSRLHWANKTIRARVGWRKGTSSPHSMHQQWTTTPDCPHHTLQWQ